MSSEYNLVIIGTLKEGIKVKKRLDSISSNIVRFAQSPVLILSEWAEKKINEIKNILVPVDGSNVSNFAAAHAALIANKTNGNITLLHVWENKDEKILSKIKRDNVDISEIKSKICEKVLNDAENTMITEKTAKKEIIDGNPSEVITNESKNYDIVIMGTWGRGGIKKFLLGDTAEYVAQHAKSPVLLVRGIPD